MANYGNFNLNRKRNGKKIIIAVASIAVIILALVFYIGLTAGSESEDMERISSAVAENVQLKQQISELNNEIAKKQQEIDDLNAQLELRPTIAPTPYMAQGGVMPTLTPAPTLSPRGKIR